jgi:predicted dehydrogenase
MLDEKVTIMKDVRIGLIGLGRFGRLHLQVLRQTGHAEITAIADIDKDTLRQAAIRYGIDEGRCYEDPFQLIEHADIDVVDIVSDEATHGPLVLHALRSGKHVIVEKPLSVSFQEAAEIKAEQEKSGKHVLVGNISRFSQPYLMIKRSIDNGTLGQVAAIRAKRNFSREWFYNFGNRIHPVYESGVHDLDLIVWYAGCRCVEVSAFERRISGFEHPDLFSSILKFENGLVASLDNSWAVPAGAPQNLVETLELDGTIDAYIEVIGEKGTAQFQLAHSGFALWTQKGIQYPETTLWPTGHEYIGGAIAAELDHFVRTILEGSPSTIMPLADSVHVLEIADAIERSARINQVVRLEGSDTNGSI